MTIREEFEQWAKPRYFPHVNTQFRRDGTYANKLVQAAWCAWQASAHVRSKPTELPPPSGRLWAEEEVTDIVRYANKAHVDGFLCGVAYAQKREAIA